jgi:rare lipoprotein A
MSKMMNPNMLPGVLPKLMGMGLSALFLVSCAETKLLVHTAKQISRESASSAPTGQSQGVYKVGTPYQVAGVWYYPKEDPQYDEKGIASWYGSKFHGRYTANGETYDMNALTAAHKTLPMPTMVRVINLENGRSIVLRVNDRGPFVHGRIIDVSRRAAQLLGFQNKGTARVRVTALNGGGEQYVSAKPKTTHEERTAVAAAPQAGVSAAALPPPPGVSAAPSTATSGVPAPEPVVRTASAFSTRDKGVSVVPVKPSALFVQAGAFIDVNRARALSHSLSSVGETRVTPVFTEGTQFYRVRVGPLQTVEAADQTLERIIAQGHPDARIVVVD